MAGRNIASVRGPAHAKYRPRTPSTPRRRLLAGWTRVLSRARSLRPDLATSPETDAALRDWIADGEALAVALAATTPED